MGILLFMLLVVAVAIWKFHSDAQQRKRTWAFYQWCLQSMMFDPRARSQVVTAGRAWYGLQRGGVVTVYDEMAISNDIKQAGG